MFEFISIAYFQFDVTLTWEACYILIYYIIYINWFMYWTIALHQQKKGRERVLYSDFIILFFHRSWDLKLIKSELTIRYMFIWFSVWLQIYLGHCGSQNFSSLAYPIWHLHSSGATQSPCMQFVQWGTHCPFSLRWNPTLQVHVSGAVQFPKQKIKIFRLVNSILRL